MEKKFLKHFTVTCALGLMVVALTNFVIDPLQYYRRNTNYPLYCNDRWQVASFIKNFSFDTIILGTSLTQNFSLGQINKTMRANPIRLSIAGATIAEQLLVLKSAIKSGKVKTVIWGIDRPYFYDSQELSVFRIPIFLYQNSLSSHFRYLINLDVLSHSLRVINSSSSADADLDKYNTWGEKELFSKEAIKKLYKETIGKAKKPCKLNIDAGKKYLEEIKKLIVANPQIKFTIFFPPYSVAFQKAQFVISADNFAEDVKFRALIMETLTESKNVLFFDFETDLEIITNLDNYKDLTHYSKEINRDMIDKINNSYNIVKSENNIAKSQEAFVFLHSYNFEN